MVAHPGAFGNPGSAPGLRCVRRPVGARSDQPAVRQALRSTATPSGASASGTSQASSRT
jgi:hypothetical protein